MRETILILGAKGRFGAAALHAFADTGWTVKAMARSELPATLSGKCIFIKGDALHLNTLKKAARGVDVIVNALNPPYGRWAKDVPVLTENVIEAAKTVGATIVVPGNIYNYGQGMPAVLSETTPHQPSNGWGKVRTAMEQAYRAAAHRGIQTLILRGGDFLEGAKTGNWFDSHIANKVAEGVFTYPGPLDRMHAWAYLPDMARAAQQLAAKRTALAPFEDIGLEGYSLTGAQLHGIVEQAVGRSLKVKGMPWWAVRLIASFAPDMKGVLAMSYLWHTPHRIDGSKLRSLLPDFQPTPAETAIKASITALAEAANITSRQVSPRMPAA